MGAWRSNVSWRGCLQNPVVTVAAFVVLVVLLAMASKPVGDGGQRPGLTVLAVREGDRFRILDPDNESWDEATRLLYRTPDAVALITYRPEVRIEGWLAPTREIVEKRVAFDVPVGGRHWQAGSRARARSAFIEWLGGARRPSSADAKEIAGGDVHRVTVLWSGYFINALIAAAFGTLLYSMLWLQHIPVWFAEMRRRKALARGLCPSCGYAIAGLPQAVCPECGNSWDARPEGQVVAGQDA